MNRLEMAKEVAIRVPVLAKRDKDRWKLGETLRAKFVSDYPIHAIPSLEIDEYVIGKGAENQSFCYRIEREMDILGRILGATALKFGVYYGKTRTEPAEQYRFRERWGKGHKEAFSSVKRAIVDLLVSAVEKDSLAIAENPLSPMFKGKILFIYYPDQFAPIYSKEHLQHFITELDLAGTFPCGADMQQTLMEYRATWPELMAQPAPLYMRLLYDLFGYPPSDDSPQVTPSGIPLLSKAVEGAGYIEKMPIASSGVQLKLKQHGNPDYEKRQKQLKRIGDRGEAIVVALEKARLLQTGKADLAGRIDHISQYDDSVGYDILSFDEDGTERPIEVKATSVKNLDRGFYITSNELEKAKALQNYHIYFVFSALSKKPRVFPVKQPVFTNGAFVLHPILYQVALSQ